MQPLQSSEHALCPVCRGLFASFSTTHFLDHISVVIQNWEKGWGKGVVDSLWSFVDLLEGGPREQAKSRKAESVVHFGSNNR